MLTFFPPHSYDRIESHFIQLIVKDVSKKVNTKLVEIEKKYEEKSSLKVTLADKVINSVGKAMSNLSISCSTTKPYLKVGTKINVPQQIPNIPVDLLRSREPKELQEKRSKLDKGSPIIIIEAPKMVKTAANSVYCPNFGLYKRGDVGRYFSSSLNFSSFFFFFQILHTLAVATN
jgi:paraquat-inducible protein B